MKMLTKFFPIIVLLALCANASAQVLDGAYMRENTVERTFVPYQNIREADAMYSKKILRVVEMREKQNHSLYFPITRMTYPAGIGVQPQRSRVNLLYLINNIGILGEQYEMHTGALIEDTIIYSLRYPVYKLNPSDITNWHRIPIENDDPLRNELLSYYETIQEQDIDGNIIDVRIPSILEDTRIMDKLWIWEEWVFDKQRSLMDVRIIAMSPDGWNDDQRIWPFWIYFPDYRPLFAKYEVFNTFNDAEHKTFDDIFFKRKFTSYIVAETNVYDNRLIADYLLGIDAIREGERIQAELFKFEHDQWEY
ncbi:MAG: gliding motility protein GldN [Bacteroidales bacterium]|nr:gliding motility protein GldN [Bacteroidales bacterium]MDD4216566.1 gliding motility protein GldN [Bacteroidales bacterium]MDY0141357.1 gliding motility protein GldN [Bacteroidales bacterium]